MGNLCAITARSGPMGCCNSQYHTSTTISHWSRWSWSSGSGRWCKYYYRCCRNALVALARTVASTLEVTPGPGPGCSASTRGVAIGLGLGFEVASVGRGVGPGESKESSTSTTVHPSQSGPWAPDRRKEDEAMVSDGIWCRFSFKRNQGPG